MKVTIVKKQSWRIPDWYLRTHSEKGLEEVLSSFNHTGKSNFYFLDYFRKKIIVDSPLSLILAGHSKAEVNELGFGFFEHILSDSEWVWLNRVNIECYNFLFNYPANRRKDLLFSYDLAVLTAKDNNIILHHNISPYKLCKNGNLWLGLCHVWVSSSQRKSCPLIIDRKTGEQYEFVDNKFTKISTRTFTEEDLIILGWMVKDLTDEQMSEQLKASSVANFKRKKRALFDKLGAGTSASAIHKAHLLGII